jgi:hypothetical protein
MKNAIVLLVNLLARLAILLGTGGTRAVLAENIHPPGSSAYVDQGRGRKLPDLPDRAGGKADCRSGYRPGPEHHRPLIARFTTCRSRGSISETADITEFCDVFDTVKETKDHGSFNSWLRQAPALAEVQAYHWSFFAAA